MCGFGIIQPQYDICAAVLAADKGVQILNSDTGVAQLIDKLRQSSRLILHLKGENFGFLYDEALALQDVVGALRFGNDETENAEFGVLCDRKRADIDVMLAEGVQNLGKSSGLIFNKNRQLGCNLGILLSP